MAIKFFDCKGFGQIEPNQVWFNRTGSVEAQVELNPEEFAAHFPMTAEEAAAKMIYSEVGAFLMVDKAAGIAIIPSNDGETRGLNMGINYSTEKIYNQYTPGRRNFCMIAGEFLPRIGYVEPGMRITTNTVAFTAPGDGYTPVAPYDGGAAYTATTTSDDVYNDIKAAVAGGKDVYAYVIEGSDGKLTFGANADDALGGVKAKVVKVYTNADGTNSFMFEFVRA